MKSIKLLVVTVFASLTLAACAGPEDEAPVDENDAEFTAGWVAWCITDKTCNGYFTAYFKASANQLSNKSYIPLVMRERFCAETGGCAKPPKAPAKTK